MLRFGHSAFLLVALWFTIRPVNAAQPEKRPAVEIIPAPKLLMPPAEGIPAPQIVIDTPDIIIGGPMPRPGTREVWQYYGLNRFGRFVPRVILTPGGDGYYYRGGEPYPWATSRPGHVMPAVVD